MEGPIILSQIPFDIDTDSMRKSLRVKQGSLDERSFKDMADQARSLGRPCAVYRESFVEERNDAGATIDGVSFRSRLLGRNLKDVMRVFPYCATCGRELDEWASDISGLRLRLWADGIMMAALGCAIAALNEDIERRFRPGRLSYMNPGSLDDWPLSEQRGLFTLVDGSIIGVQLTDTFLMRPLKTTTGIMFPSEEDFQSCRYCSRDQCPGRRAPYDPDAVARDLHG